MRPMLVLAHTVLVLGTLAHSAEAGDVILVPAQPKTVVIAPPNTRVIALPSRLQNRSLDIPLSIVVPPVSTTLVLRNGVAANPQAGWGSTDWTFVAGPRTVASPSLIAAGAAYPMHGGFYGGTGFYSPRYYSD